MYITVNDYQIHYKESGTGDEVAIILQGWGTHLSIYDSIAACISNTCRVIQFDFPGFGNSQEPRQPWDVDAYADFFLDFLHALGLTHVTLLGHSYGGRVIIKLASRTSLPVSINRIVLIDSAGILPQKTPKQKWSIRRYKLLKKIVLLKPVYFMCPELIDDWISHQGSADYRNSSPMMKQCLVKAVNEDLTALLPKIQQEVLLIWGDTDTATPISDARLMEERLPHAGLAVIKGAGHFCFLEQPALFNSILQSYFSA